VTWSILTTNTVADGPVTLWAKPTLVRTVNRVSFNFFLHGLFALVFTSLVSLAVGMVYGARGVDPIT
jgi:hypothetical protein